MKLIITILGLCLLSFSSKGQGSYLITNFSPIKYVNDYQAWYSIKAGKKNPQNSFLVITSSKFSFRGDFKDEYLIKNTIPLNDDNRRRYKKVFDIEKNLNKKGLDYTPTIFMCSDKSKRECIIRLDFYNTKPAFVSVAVLYEEDNYGFQYLVEDGSN